MYSKNSNKIGYVQKKGGGGTFTGASFELQPPEGTLLGQI